MIHIISKEYYLKNRYKGKMKKILIESQTFPLNNKFYMKDGICFMYLMELGFLIVPENSNLDQNVLNEEINKSEWYIEKYEKPLKLTKNYINAFPPIYIYERPEISWIENYDGFIRVWNTFTNEDFIFYKKGITTGGQSFPKSYLCKLALGNEVKFPIDYNYAKEFSYFIKDILEWI